MSSLSGVGFTLTTSKVFQVILTQEETTILNTYFSELRKSFPNLKQDLKPEEAVQSSVAVLLSQAETAVTQYKINCSKADPLISAVATIIFRHYEKLKTR